nr:MAG TPA: hypothetical protein [Caudoviricetes sp.]
MVTLFFDELTGSDERCIRNGERNGDFCLYDGQRKTTVTDFEGQERWFLEVRPVAQVK